MKLILHIGNHKAGSSTIQTGLLEKQKTLLNFGILYPNTALVICAHHNLAFSLKKHALGFESDKKPKSLSDYQLEIINEAKVHNSETIVISSEEFMTFSAQNITDFSNFCDIFEDVKIIVYLRNHVHLLESSYKFSILWDVTLQTLSFENYLQRNIDSDYHEYDRRLENWSNLHKHTKIIVKNFHREIDDGLMKNFFKEIGVGEEETLLIPDQIINASLTRLGSLILRANNREKTYNRRKLLEKIKLLETNKVFDHHEKLYLPTQIKQINNRFRKSNTVLIEKFGIDISFNPNQAYLDLCRGETYLDSDLLKIINADSNCLI